MAVSDWFGRYTHAERELLAFYTQKAIDAGVAPGAAKKTMRESLKEAVRESKQVGTYFLPANFGDIILGVTTTESPAVAALADAVCEELPAKQAEGVTGDDIRSWWNLNDVERRMIVKWDDFERLVFYRRETRRGSEGGREHGSRTAAVRVRKRFPMYGDPEDTSHTSGDDRPLPLEMKDRINAWLAEQAEYEPEKLESQIEAASSMNALLRSRIKAGRL